MLRRLPDSLGPYGSNGAGPCLGSTPDRAGGASHERKLERFKARGDINM